MAYKFQLGPARLSGSTLYKNGLDVSGSFTIEDPSSLAGDGLVRNGTELELNIADMAAELSSAGLADTDEFAVSDGGIMKKIDFQHVRDSIFADIAGDATKRRRPVGQIEREGVGRLAIVGTFIGPTATKQQQEQQ